MAHQDITIKELVDRIERGDIRLPEMQRQYVWQKTRVRDLLDSLYRGYPSGTILTWETDEKVSTREFAIEQQEQQSAGFQLLLDGQQRLTSLSALLRGEPVKVKNLVRPIDILFNLEHPETVQLITEVDEEDETNGGQDTADASEDDLLRRANKLAFVVHTPKVANLPHWVSVKEVLSKNDDIPFLEKAGVLSLKDENYKKYTNRLNRLRKIKDYTYRVHIPEREKSYEEVTEIFVRVNSLGAKLRSSDLALAQITAKWPGSLEIFQTFEQHYLDNGFPIDQAFLLKNLIVFITNQSRYRGINKISKEEIQEGWRKAKVGMEFAINFLRSNVKIDSPSLLSSNWIAVVVAVFGSRCNYKLTREQEQELRHWVIAASIKGRFSRGSSETILDQDLTALQKNTSVSSLFQLLDTQVGRRDILANDLTHRNSQSAYFKSMFIAFQNDGAIDWFTALKISLKYAGNTHKLQFHHIFPQAVLRKAGYEKQNINDICNLAFIGGQTNRRLGAKLPNEYFPEIIRRLGEPALRNQCIPIDEDLWKLENYDKFLLQRRELVAERLNQLLEE